MKSTVESKTSTTSAMNACMICKEKAVITMNIAHMPFNYCRTCALYLEDEFVKNIDHNKEWKEIRKIKL